jgi:hypothetical protein
MPEKKTISAREVVADIKVGMTDEQLMAKHMLSAKGLESLKTKLVTAGLLTQDQLSGKGVPVVFDKKEFAKNIANAVLSGLNDIEISTRFGIPQENLPKVYDSLVKAGYLTLDDLKRTPENEKTPEQGATPAPKTPESQEPPPVDQPQADSPEKPPALDGRTVGICLVAALATGLSLAQGTTTTWLWFLVWTPIFAIAACFGYSAFLEKYTEKVKYVVIAGIIFGLAFIGNVGKTPPGSTAQKSSSGKVTNSTPATKQQSDKSVNKNPIIEVTLDHHHTVKGAASKIAKAVWKAADDYTQAETLLVKVKMSSSGLSDKYGNDIRGDLAMGQIKLNSQELAEVRLYKTDISYAWEDTNLVVYTSLLRNMKESHLLRKD